MSDHRRELEDLRRRMAEVDVEILRGLENRAALARQVGKLSAGDAPFLPGHDQEALATLERLAGDKLPVEAVRSVFREVHAATFSLEAPVRVSYVGPEGNFCRVAAVMQFGAGAQLTPAPEAAAALDEVTRRRVDFAVVPWESSVEGPIQASILALLATDLTLVAKAEIAATFSAMCPSGKADDVQRIYAFAADSAACQRYLAASFPRASVVDVRSPVVACQLASEEPGGAAIVAHALGESLGLRAIAENVGDDAGLRLRYAIVSFRPASRSGSDATAFVFTVHDQPGALFDVLRHFAERGINLKTIQSRPMPGEKWNYLFYVEVTGHVTDRPVVTSLEAIKRQTRVLRVLGSFPS